MNVRTAMANLVVASLAVVLSHRGLAAPGQTRTARPANTFTAPVAGPLSPSAQTEVHSDRRVTFRLLAPGASRVELALTATPRRPMVKDGSGLWSVVVGPLAPEIYTYTFIVDGVAVPDPANPSVSPGRAGHSTVLELPELPAPLAVRDDVPHGAQQVEQYTSRVLGVERRLVVHLPAEYFRAPQRRFPVLYLRHGAGGRDGDWHDVGRAGTILDNLVARGDAVPMIIVMPNGHPGLDSGATAEGTALVERELVEEIVPLIERKYRAMPAADSRAIAGLSMGAGQAFLTAVHHPQKFAWVGAFSSGLLADREFRLETGAPELVADPAAFNRRIRLLFLSCGTEDARYPGALDLLDALTAHQVRHEWFTTPGDHEWKVWRHSLAAMLPKLFRASKTKGSAAGRVLLQSSPEFTGIRDAEQQWARAGSAATGLLARNAAGTDMYGRWLDRDATAASRRPYGLEGELSIRALGRRAAAVVGTAVDASSGAARRFLHVWAEREGRWELVVFHETAVAPDGARKPPEVAAPLVDSRLTGTATGLEDEVRRGEQERRDIFVAHSAERYSRLATPDYLSILINGVVQGRQERAAMVPSHFVYDTSRVTVTMIGDDTGVMQAAQTSEDGPMKSTRVWVKRDGRWLVAAHAGSLEARVGTAPR